jgi:site-specific recombinase XerD
MPSDASNAEFQSVLAPLMDRFLQEKRACGYAYHEPFRILHRLDDFLVQQGLETLELPRGPARNWLAKKPHESASTQQQRITVFRQFSKFLLTAGCPAYVPDATVTARKSIYVPRMLTEEELRKFFRAVDTLEPTARSPLRHLIMPEVFRLLYGCGFRVREVLNLRIRDVDLNQGIITVRQGKFRKDRLVPPALSLVNRLRKYAGYFDSRPPDAVFFPGPNGRPLPCAPFTHSFVKCCCNAEFPTLGGARAPGFTIIVTYSPSTPYAVGTETVRISRPNFLFWHPIWGINTFLELSTTFISPPRSFPKSQHESRRLLVRSCPGELLDEADRSFHSCDQFLNAPLGRTAEPQSKYD